MTTTVPKKMPHRIRIQWKNIGLHVALLAGCIIMLLPFFWMLITSFKTDTEITSLKGVPLIIQF